MVACDSVHMIMTIFLKKKKKKKKKKNLAPYTKTKLFEIPPRSLKEPAYRGTALLFRAVPP